MATIFLVIIAIVLIYGFISDLFTFIKNAFPAILTIGLFCLFVWLFFKLNILSIIKSTIFSIYENKYYKSKEFNILKSGVAKYIKNCNELNDYIFELKNTHIGKNQSKYGKSIYYDNSEYNYERPEYENLSQNENVYNCSRSICDNARMQPFKYICKYFDIDLTEENLEKFENMLNKYESIEKGIELLSKQKNNILLRISNNIPSKIKKYGYSRFQYELGFRIIGFKDILYPVYTFQYVSSGGYASTKCDIVMDIENLNDFICYLSEKIKFRKSVAGQRALMTSALRTKILQRDNYTCKECGNNFQKEPNLLLEIDHIIPLSKGGITSEDNLQVLCWRCNRRKGAKMI